MRTLTFYAMLLLVPGALVGCGEKEEATQVPLLGSWKLVGFGNTVSSAFRDAEPKDCEKCYTITFLKNGTIAGQTSTNEIGGEYRIKGVNLDFLKLGGTEINELFDGHKYVEALHQVNRFEIVSKQLKLYYGDTDYLLFKKK